MLLSRPSESGAEVRCARVRGRVPISSVLALVLFAVVASGAHGQGPDYYAWETLSPEEQRDAEAMVIPWGLGSIFVPAMTDPEYEPLYSVYEGDSLVAVQTMGSSVLVRPGGYRVYLGSGSLDQRIERAVQVHRGHATMVEPMWSGLVVRILDESRNSVKESYEIFRMGDAKSFGVRASAEEELGENPITWILPPGLYKIVKLGESFNTYVNFATVNLKPGGLTRFTIVIDGDTGNFIGAGILETESALKRIRDWKVYTALHGSFIMNHSRQTTEDDAETDFTFSSQMENKLRYERGRHSVLSRTLVDEGFSKQEGLSFRTVLDRVSLKNVYVFDVFREVGLYGRFVVESRLFQSKHYFETGDTSYVKVGEDGRVLEQGRGDEVQLSPPFFPLSLQEGFGLNLIVLRSLRATLYVRSGYGFRQTYTREVFREAKGDTVYQMPVFEKVPSTTLRGFESWIVGELRVTRNLLVNAELDMLFPSEGQGEPVYELEAVFNLRLTKEISLHHTVRWRDKNSPYVQRENILQLRYTYLLF